MAQHSPPFILLKADQVATMLNISRAKAYRMMQNDEIPAVRFGRSVRVRPEDLEAFIQENMSGLSGKD